jgi:hypothetical protein
MPNLTIRHAAMAKSHANSVTEPPLARSWNQAPAVTARLLRVAAPFPPDENVAAMNHHIHIMLAQERLADRHAAALPHRLTRATITPRRGRQGATAVARLARAVRTSR